MKSRKAGVLLVALALLATGCRGGGEADGESAVNAPGVTDEACPEAVNADNGCIYLGTISDLTQGPFAPLGVPITDAQAAFWNRVNEDGGIGGYDIDVTTYVKDNLYNPQTHQQVYGEIEGDVLALAQTLGSPTTLAIIPDMDRDEMIGAPASWTSLWAFEDAILESGANYCVEGMNAVDYMVGEKDISSVMAVGFPGDYGGDGAAGAEIAAEANGLEFTGVETAPGQVATVDSINPGILVEDGVITYQDPGVTEADGSRILDTENIVATFAEDGPRRCSGLPVVRYSAAQLDAEFGERAGESLAQLPLHAVDRFHLRLRPQPVVLERDAKAFQESAARVGRAIQVRACKVDGQLRGDFACLVPAHAVGHREQPKVRVRHELVLVGLANPAGVRHPECSNHETSSLDGCTPELGRASGRGRDADMDRLESYFIFEPFGHRRRLTTRL